MYCDTTTGPDVTRSSVEIPKLLVDKQRQVGRIVGHGFTSSVDRVTHAIPIKGGSYVEQEIFEGCSIRKGV